MDTALDLLARATSARRHGSLDTVAEQRLEAAFACSRRLAVYGTLLPGEANHQQLAGCGGTWSAGTVTGRRGQREHPVFTFDPAAPPVAVRVLCSDVLPAHLARLDAFEGEQYRRILVPVTQPDGGWTIANLYEAVLPVDA